MANGTKKARYTEKDVGREVFGRNRDGQLWRGIVGPSLKIICKTIVEGRS